MRAYPLIALAALSCSPAAQDQASPTAPNASTAAPTAPDRATPSPVATTAPTPGDLKTFGDWTIGCDNGLSCQANALVPDTDSRDGYLLLLVRRDGGDAPTRLIVPLGEKPPATAMLAIDGTPLARLSADPGGQTATIPLDRARAATLANGTTIVLTTPSGPPVAHASLAGLAAALLYMDDRQHRVGTASALRKPGPGTTPAAPALPVIVTPPPSAAPPKTLTVSQATRLIGPDNAFCSYAIGPVEPEAHRLDATHSLALVPHPCGNGAYNLFASAFVVDEAGHAAPARFDAVVGISDDDTDELVNVDWDAGARRLTTFPRARGIGDCGSRQAFAWDGTRFRLATQADMGECRGSTDYIRTWHAQVTPR